MDSGALILSFLRGKGGARGCPQNICSNPTRQPLHSTTPECARVHGGGFTVFNIEEGGLLRTLHFVPSSTIVDTHGIEVWDSSHGDSSLIGIVSSSACLTPPLPDSRSRLLRIFCKAQSFRCQYGLGPWEWVQALPRRWRPPSVLMGAIRARCAQGLHVMKTHRSSVSHYLASDALITRLCDLIASVRG